MNINNRNENPYYDSHIQSSLNKLISEEWYAGLMYQLFINAVQPNDKYLIDGIMETTADDELNDHMGNLIKIARKYGYKIPSTIAEFKKYAGSGDSTTFETFKTNKTAETYLKLAIESEKRAIASYLEALSYKKLDICPEIELIINNNYYDELEHLLLFDFLLKTLDIEADVQIVNLRD